MGAKFLQLTVDSLFEKGYKRTPKIRYQISVLFLRGGVVKEGEEESTMVQMADGSFVGMR